MRSALDKIIFMSEDNRKWVLDRLSDKEKNKLKQKLSENHDIKISTCTVDNNVDNERIIWRSEALNDIPLSRIISCLDKMPDIFVHIFLDYEGESARNFFVSASRNPVLARYIAERPSLKYPRMHGQAASKYFYDIVQTIP